MISENNRKFLRKISFLENFSDQELSEFFRNLKNPIKFPEGTALITDGKADLSFYVVLNGTFSVYKKRGKEKIKVAEINKAEVIGELSEYVGGARNVTVIATSPNAMVLKVDVKSYPLELRLKIRENYCHILTKRLIKRNDEHLELKSRMAEIINNCEKRIHESSENAQKEISLLKEKVAEQEKTIKSLRNTPAE